MNGLLADGIYIGLPMADYLADPALSGSAFYALLTDPGAITWDSPANPLWKEEASTVGQLRGSASHCAILEGIEAYEAAYCVAPNGALKTGDDMSAWLARAKAERADCAGLRTSGKVAELRARIEDARQRIAEDDPLWPIFYDEKVGGRAVLSAGDDAFVRLLHRFVHSDPDCAKHVTGGLPEVTIVLTREGVRFKCRIDYMTASTDLDLKTYGRPPNLDMDLKRHLVRQNFYNGAHLQAAHNHSMASAAHVLFQTDQIELFGATQRDTLNAIMFARDDREPVFRWLFVRMDGAPASMVVPFRQSDGMYQHALQQIDHATDIYREYSERCGAGELWLTSHGEQEISEMDWPMSAWEGRA